MIVEVPAVSMVVLVSSVLRLGEEETDRATWPVKPLRAVTVMVTWPSSSQVLVACGPWQTSESSGDNVRDVGLAEITKSGAAGEVTVKVNTAELEDLPLGDPVIVAV